MQNYEDGDVMEQVITHNDEISGSVDEFDNDFEDVQFTNYHSHNGTYGLRDSKIN